MRPGKGGSGKTNFRYSSWDTNDLQCLVVILDMFGSLGSCETANAGLDLVGCLGTRKSAFCLGMARALAMAPFITPRG